MTWACAVHGTEVRLHRKDVAGFAILLRARVPQLVHCKVFRLRARQPLVQPRQSNQHDESRRARVRRRRASFRTPSTGRAPRGVPPYLLDANPLMVRRARKRRQTDWSELEWRVAGVAAPRATAWAYCVRARDNQDRDRVAR